jgi:hypothetical protein
LLGRVRLGRRVHMDNHTQSAYSEVQLEFIKASLFTRLLAEYLSDDEYRYLQLTLAANPELGDVIPGTGGVRKLRWHDPRRRKGKRGGLRVIYYYLGEDAQVWFLTLYDKNEAADLSPRERRLLRAAIEQEVRERSRRRAQKGK